MSTTRKSLIAHLDETFDYDPKSFANYSKSDLESLIAEEEQAASTRSEAATKAGATRKANGKGKGKGRKVNAKPQRSAEEMAEIRSNAAHKAWATRTGEGYGFVSLAIRTAILSDPAYINRFTVSAAIYLAVLILESLAGTDRAEASTACRAALAQKGKSRQFKAMRAVESEWYPEDAAENVDDRR